MPIAPINNAFTKSYNVGFTSLKTNKEKNTGEHHTASTFMKAVPLATMIAMSPLNAANVNGADVINEAHNIELVEAPGMDNAEQSRKIVASKEFPCNTASNAKVRVDLVNTEGGSGFDKIELVYTGKNGVVYDEGEFNEYVTGITKYNFDVISDDGVNQGTMPLNTFSVRVPLLETGDLTLAHDDAVAYITEQLAKNPKKDVIPVKTYNRKLAPTLGGGLQNNPKAVTINDVSGLNIDMSTYKKTAPSRVIKGDNDKYTISFYKDKSSGRNLVTCEKASNPGNEFRVAMVGDFSATIEKTQHSPSIATYPLVILRNDKDGFGLMDNTLANELKNISQSSLGKGAYICPAVDYEYMLVGKGAIANVTE